MILTGLRTLLLSHSDLTELANFSGVFVNRVDQVKPVDYILLTKMNQDDNARLDGTGGLYFTDVDIDCKAATAARSQAIAEVVNAFLSDYSGLAGSQTIEAVVKQDEDMTYEPPQDASDSGRHVVTLDFQLQWRK